MDIDIQLEMETELKDNMHSPHFVCELGTGPIAFLEQRNIVFIDKLHSNCTDSVRTPSTSQLNCWLRGTNKRERL